MVFEFPLSGVLNPLPRFARSIPGNVLPLCFDPCGEKIQSAHFAGDLWLSMPYAIYHVP